MAMQQDLREGAQRILTTLDDGDVDAAYREVQRLVQLRELNLYDEIGRITRGLHDALAAVSAEAAGSLAQATTGEIEESPRERLRYVSELTANAANRTMDLVEGSQPHAGRVSASASELVGFLDDPELNLGQLRHYCRDEAEVIRRESEAISHNLQDILLAQGYQDLSGQIIQRVIALLQRLEDELVLLVRRCADVEQATGVFARNAVSASHVEAPDPLRAEGPLTRASTRSDVLTGQDEVDKIGRAHV